jgi:small subunit ribosomal protein S17
VSTTPDETTTAVDETAVDENTARGYRKTREGLVVSDKMDKTVVVAVEDRVKHPKYGKVLRRTKKYKAHDEQNECGVGDRVLLMETRPLSATKRWRVAGILEKAK